jgi:hypothetical protein
MSRSVKAYEKLTIVSYMSDRLMLKYDSLKGTNATYEHEKPDKCEERCDSTSLYSH